MMLRVDESMNKMIPAPVAPLPAENPSPALEARRVLIPFVATSLVAMVAVQAVLALSSWRALMPLILSAAVVVGVFVWFWYNRIRLARIPFGALIAHVSFFFVFYVTNGLSVLLAVISHADSGASTEQIGQALFGTPWFRTILILSWLWSGALLIHLVTSAHRKAGLR